MDHLKLRADESGGEEGDGKRGDLSMSMEADNVEMGESPLFPSFLINKSLRASAGAVMSALKFGWNSCFKGNGTKEVTDEELEKIIDRTRGTPYEGKGEAP